MQVLVLVSFLSGKLNITTLKLYIYIAYTYQMRGR